MRGRPTVRERRVRLWSAALVALVLVGSGCNSKLIRPPAIVSVDSGGHGVATSIREQNRSFPSIFTAFVPSTVPLHPGDALNFQLRDTGEPHTVALGTLVDAAVEAVERLGPTAEDDEIAALAQMRAVPAVFPAAAGAGVPTLVPDAAEESRDDDGFDGTEELYSSGVLQEGEPFRIKLADDIAPGAYRFMCLVHRARMTGTVEVRDPDTPRPPVAELRDEADQETEQIASSLEPVVREVATEADPDSGMVQAGGIPEGTARGSLAAYFPNEVNVGIGDPVRFRVVGRHTISFRPSRDAKEGLVLSDGDGVRLNEDAWLPTPAGQDAPWDGEGAWSSGVLDGTAKAVSYEMRFGAAGTYRFECLIHPVMRGTVSVR